MSKPSWSRLERGYWSDDKVVRLRQQHGFIAEVFHTRFIATGAAVRCPADREFEVLAETLGFPESEVQAVAAVAQAARAMGLCSAKMSRKSMIQVVVWDLKKRDAYRGPKSLAPGYEAEKKRRQRATSDSTNDSDTVPETSRDTSPATNVRTNERTELPPEHPSDVLSPPTAKADDEPAGRALIAKYLGLLAGSSNVWKPIGDQQLIDVAGEYGFGFEKTGRMLGDLWQWWSAKPPQQRWRTAPIRGWRSWCKRECERLDRERDQARLGSEPPTVPPPKQLSPAEVEQRQREEAEDEERQRRDSEERIRQRASDKLGIPIAEIDEEALRMYHEIRADELEGTGHAYMAEQLRKLAGGVGQEVP